jgi:hypothetical protein
LGETSIEKSDARGISSENEALVERAARKSAGDDIESGEAAEFAPWRGKAGDCAIAIGASRGHGICTREISKGNADGERTGGKKEWKERKHRISGTAGGSQKLRSSTMSTFSIGRIR